MANTRAPSTIVTVPLTGQVDFNIPFEYLARKYVELTLLGVTRQPLTLNVDYRFVSKTTVSLTVLPPANFDKLEIRRVTSATERLVDFHDGSILRAYDLNLSQIQTLHVAEEARDLTADTIGVNDEGHLDARNRRIVNLADAVDGRDAVTYGQVIQWSDSAYNSAVQAAASAGLAGDANVAAHVAMNAARASELSAQTSATGAASSAQTAVDARNDTVAAQADVRVKHDNVVSKHAEVMAVVPELDQAVNLMTGLGNVPVGTVAMTLTKQVAVGWLRCGESFNTATYPALARMFPSGVIPSFDHLYPKGATRDGDVGVTGDAAFPAHTHVMPQQEVRGNITDFNHGTKSVTVSSAGEHSHSFTGHAGFTESGTPAYPVGRSSTAGLSGRLSVESAGAHSHAASVDIGSHGHSFSGGHTIQGDTGVAGTGANVEVAHRKVWFIIKAAEGIADKDEAMQVVGTIVGRVAAAESAISSLQTTVEQLAASTTHLIAKYTPGVVLNGGASIVPFKVAVSSSEVAWNPAGDFILSKAGVYAVDVSVSKASGFNLLLTARRSRSSDGAALETEVVAYDYNTALGTVSGSVYFRCDAGDAIVVLAQAVNATSGSLVENVGNLHIRKVA